jgi:hypothetical protein
LANNPDTADQPAKRPGQEATIRPQRFLPALRHGIEFSQSEHRARHFS